MVGSARGAIISITFALIQDEDFQGNHSVYASLPSWSSRGRLFWSRSAPVVKLLLPLQKVPGDGVALVLPGAAAVVHAGHLHVNLAVGAVAHVHAWRGDQSTERREYIPGGGTNQLRGKSIYLKGGPIN
eukprot:8898558-Pyramimonas_sp.AAC.1